MVLLSKVSEHHQGELERLHGHQLLPSHHQALQAMRRCRRQGSDLMVLHCTGCSHSVKVPHYCGHRSCPHCQHKGSQRWIERQQAKLLPVGYFLITFKVPANLRALFWSQQRITYDLLLKTAWQTVDSFARRDPKLKGITGAHAVLHTHSRRLDFHPHVHLIVPAGAPVSFSMPCVTRKWSNASRPASTGCCERSICPGAKRWRTTTMAIGSRPTDGRSSRP